MDIHFAPLSLAGLDALKSEVLCLPVFADERPLRGAPGLLDWRLCGRLSRLLVEGMLVGEEGEALLMPPPEERVAVERLLFLGAGARATFDEERCRALMAALCARVRALRVRTFALALPHDAAGALDPARAIDLLLEACAADGERLDEVVIVDTPEAQRAMEPRIERARRRALTEE